MGVLQRIALAYGLAAFICVTVPNKKIWLVGVFMLIGYWTVNIFFGSESPLSLEGNIATTIDTFFFGTNHLYSGFGIPFDPEGLLGTFSATVSIMAGYVIGLKIKESKDNNSLVKNLLYIGFISIAISLIWNEFYPFNKPLWSSTYVLYTSGVASVLLGIFIFVIDIKKFNNWNKPFIIFGINPMVLYVFSILFVKVLFSILIENNDSTIYDWLFQNVFVVIAQGEMKLASLLFAIGTVLICWVMGLILYKKNIIVKI
jgi:predicted acyltransferase